MPFGILGQCCMVLGDPARSAQRDEAICLVGWLEVLACAGPVEL